MSMFNYLVPVDTNHYFKLLAISSEDRLCFGSLYREDDDYRLSEVTRLDLPLEVYLYYLKDDYIAQSHIDEFKQLFD